MVKRRATPSGRLSADTSELGAPAYRGLSYALPFSLALWALLLGGCATDPIIASALRSYDLAVAQGLATERLVKPHVRIRDDAPWGHTRRVEIDR